MTVQHLFALWSFKKIMTATGINHDVITTKITWSINKTLKICSLLGRWICGIVFQLIWNRTSQYPYLEAVQWVHIDNTEQNYHFTVRLALLTHTFVSLLDYLINWCGYLLIYYSLGVRCQLGCKSCSFLQSHVICKNV